MDDQTSQTTDNLSGQNGPEPAAETAQPAPGYSLGSSPSSDDNSTDSSSLSSSSGAPTDVDDIPATAPPSQSDDGSESNVSSQSDANNDNDPSSSSSSDDDELTDIKNQALAQLTPIVPQLDQTPEEKYRTLMLLIQASDDRSLIKQAYEAANNIEDKKTKAEALLNIVNEINYFSTQNADEQTPAN